MAGRWGVRQPLQQIFVHYGSVYKLAVQLLVQITAGFAGKLQAGGLTSEGCSHLQQDEVGPLRRCSRGLCCVGSDAAHKGSCALHHAPADLHRQPCKQCLCQHFSHTCRLSSPRCRAQRPCCIGSYTAHQGSCALHHAPADLNWQPCSSSGSVIPDVQAWEGQMRQKRTVLHWQL